MSFAMPQGGEQLYITEIGAPELRGRNVVCRGRSCEPDWVMPLEVYRGAIEQGQKFLAELGATGSRVVPFRRREG